jgi:hypothetical protein
MKRSHGWQLLALAALLAVGCRAPRGMTALERELRYQEDKIYELQDYLHEYRALLRDCQAENRRLREEHEDGGSGTSGGRAPDGPPDIRIPDVELPGVEIPGVDSPSAEDSASLLDEQQIRIAGRSAPRHWPADQRIVQLTLKHPRGTASAGVQVMVQPRNAAGEIVPASGQLSVAILDPTATTAEYARVARWQFSAPQTELLVRDTKSGRGADLDLLWPGELPINSELQLYARIITDDGRRIQSDVPLSLSTRETASQSAGPLPPLDPGQRRPHEQQAMPEWERRRSSRPEPIRTDTIQTEPIRIDQRQEIEPPLPVIETEVNERQAVEPDRPRRAAAAPKWSPYR